MPMVRGRRKTGGKISGSLARRAQQELDSRSCFASRVSLRRAAALRKCGAKAQPIHHLYTAGLAREPDPPTFVAAQLGANGRVDCFVETKPGCSAMVLAIEPASLLFPGRFAKWLARSIQL